MAKRKIGRPKKLPEFKELLQKTIPAADIFDEDELTMYEALVNIYLKDFDESQLTANDMDDLMGIAMNKVLEIRLLKASKGDPTMQMDVSSAIERLRKQTEKMKENLAARRKDRIDPKKYSGFSIVDLAISFDVEKQRKLMERTSTLELEESKVLESDLLIGNRNDADAKVIDVG